MSVDHLLLHCKFSHALWSAIFEVFRIHWVMWKTVSALLFAWRNWFGKHLSTIWNMVPACLMWLVWKECNTHIFEVWRRWETLRSLKNSSSRCFVSGAHVWGFTNCISISEFLHSIRLSFWTSCIFSWSKCSPSWTWCSAFLNKSFIIYQKKI